jgi:hypothetical protein
MLELWVHVKDVTTIPILALIFGSTQLILFSFLNNPSSGAFHWQILSCDLRS